MYDLERQEKILEILKEKKSISVDKLTKLLFFSPATIRRDLSAMEKRGLVKRTFGGAILQESPDEESALIYREKTMMKEKKQIAEKCANLLRDHTAMFIDSSSTCTYLVPFLKNFKHLNLVTNGLKISLMLLEQTSCKTLLVSGYVNSMSNSTIGNLTLKTLEKIHCSYSIISCSGVSLEYGLTEATIDQAEIKLTMAENSDQIILLCDSSKFNQAKLFKSIPLSKITYLITDKRPPEEYVTYCLEHNIKLIY